MKRPNQHITDTKSQRIFERIIPVEWVCREIRPDYGVDYLVEIFQSNESTGKTFFVQLKGSTQEFKDDTFEKQLTTDNLKYYDSLALPVIIICVSVTTEKIWGIWANKLLEQNPLKDEQKTVLISLNKDYLINESSFRQITSHLEVFDKLGVFTESDSDLTKSFNEHILKWIENYYSQSISIKFNHLPRHLHLSTTFEKECVQLKITLNSYSKTIIIDGLNEKQSFLYRPKFDSNDINDFNKEVLLSTAIGLARYDIKGSLSLLINLISKIDFSNQNKWVDLDPLGLLTLAKNENIIHLYNSMIQELIKNQFYEMFLFFDLAYFVAGTDELQKYRVENLKTVINSTTNQEIQGTCHYNIGNILKPKSISAIEHYFAAAKLFPEYRSRYYWWLEIAGLFFAKKHYHWAGICYKRSLSLAASTDKEKKYYRIEKVFPEEGNPTIALIGDCLFMQGRFKESNDHFENYLETSLNKSQEWILKNMVCLELMNGKLDNVDFDRDKSMELCEKSLSENNNQNRIETLNRALELWPTNGLAWFNLGVALDKKQNFEEALFAFLTTGLIQDGDKEAQFNALTISFTLRKFDLMQAILIYISSKHGESVINDLSDYIMQKNIPLEGKKGLIKSFEKMMETVKTMHSKH